jgi:3-phosphoshikimate 1-carboxyvinyltransferase
MTPQPLPNILPIVPFVSPARGDVSLPGSKSITNRALLLAALSDGSVTLTGVLFSEDTRIMAGALGRLGFEIEEMEADREIRVVGRRGKIPAERAGLFVGNAGTAARFLTALCAAAPGGTFDIDGVPQMRERPMKGLIDALRSQGAKITCLGEEGFFPLRVEAHGLAGGLVKIDPSESSQMLSALLMVGPLAKRAMQIEVTSHVRWPFVKMTMMFMSWFGRIGVGRKLDDRHFLVPHGQYGSPGRYPIESDATAASYFFALPLAVGGTLHFPSLSLAHGQLQGDLAFAEVLNRVGAQIQDRAARKEKHDDPTLQFLADNQNQSLGVDASYHPPGPKIGVDQDFSEFSDTFLTLAAIAPLLTGPTRITGIAHTRKQETDRVGNMAKELRKLGQEVEETEDSLTIHPRPLPSGQTIETYGDHRFAMSFAILGCHDLGRDGRPWLSIKDPACCAKTFPNFFDELDRLRQDSREQM